MGRRRAARRLLIAGVMAAVLAAGAALAVRQALAVEELAPPGVSDTAAPAPTPVLSARRLPEMLARASAAATLGETVSAWAGGLGPDACLVVWAGDRELVAHNAELPLIPASTLKILVGLAAIERLGPDTVLRTEVVAAAAPRDGVVDGDLWLVGGGDPLLMTEGYALTFRRQPQVRTPVEDLADAVVAAGVRQVTGSVRGDESRYDTERYPPSWEPRYITQGQSGPLSALNLDDGFTVLGPDGRRPSPDPPTDAARVLTDMLVARGVSVAGPPGSGVAPPGAVEVAGIDSLSMGGLVAQMLRESDNGTAELLTKELGLRHRGEGSTAAGVDVVRDVATEAGLEIEGWSQIDGSGLDRGNRITCRLLDDSLEGVEPADEIGTGLAVAAESGTLAERFRGTGVEGRMLAKTGSLNEVVSLAGLVVGPEGTEALGVVRFGLVVNGPLAATAGLAVQDDLARLLAAWPQAPAVEALAPPGA